MKYSRWAELLSSIFMMKKKDWFFDIPAYYLKHWIAKKEIPQIDKSDCIYGDFLFHEVIEDYLQLYFPEFDENWKPLEYNIDEHLDFFRKRIIRHIIFDLDDEWLSNWEEDFIHSDDVSIFVQTVTKNRIRKDWDITSQQKVLYQYMAGGSLLRDPENESFSLEEKEIMTIEERIEQDWLENLEKEARKKSIHPDYIDFVDAINLKKLKLLLRDPLWRPFVPIWRQREALVSMKRLNFVATWRRSGKSTLAAYLAARQVYIPNQTIIFVVPTLRTTGSVVWRYLFNIMKWDPNMSFNRQDWTIINRKNWSEIQFISGEREASIRWHTANLIVFDEAAFLSEEIYETAIPLIRTTNGMCFAITTVNNRTAKNWFYYRLVEAEIKKHDSDAYMWGRRVTLWENPLIPDEEKQKIAEEGKRNMKIFQCEWMAEFGDGDAFNFSKFWIVDYKPVEVMIKWVRRTLWRDEALNKDLNAYSHFIIWHDSAKLKDKPWCVVLWVRLKKNAQWIVVQEWCDVVMSWYMDWFEYMDQVWLIVELKKMLNKDKCTITIEYNMWWVTVEEIFRRIYDENVTPILTVAWINHIKEWRLWRVWKDYLIWKLSSAIDRWTLRWFSFMDQLRLEVETYDLNDTNQKRSSWHHFDIVSALMMAVFIADKMWVLERYEDTPDDVLAQRIVDSYSDSTHMSVMLAKNRNDYNRYEKFWY